MSTEITYMSTNKDGGEDFVYNRVHDVIAWLCLQDDILDRMPANVRAAHEELNHWIGHA